KLVVIDEAFDWVDAYTVNLADMRSMFGDIISVLPDVVQPYGRELLSIADTLTELAASGSDRKLEAAVVSRLAQAKLADLEDAIVELPGRKLSQWVGTDSETAADLKQPLGEDVAKKHYL